MPGIPQQGHIARHFQKLADQINKTLHPSPSKLATAFKWGGIVLAGMALFTLLFVSSPFAPPELVLGIYAKAIAISPKETLAHVCEWVGLVSQIGIVLFFGGAAFSEGFVNEVKTRLNDFQTAYEAAEEFENKQRVEELKSKYDTIFNLMKSNKISWQDFKAFYEALFGIYTQTREAGARLTWFAAQGLVLKFPGGLYGFLGLLFLSVQAIAISLKIVLDYAPVHGSGG